ncbi:MAG TPA: acyl-CoA dehydrogenase family protein [Thermodesulfobacteriota bacterium]
MAEKFMLTPFREEHEIFRQQCRRFVEKELAPHVMDWEAKKDFPDEVFRRVGEMGLHGILIPEEYGGSGGDYLMASVWVEESTRIRSGGVEAGIGMHGLIVLPAIAKFGNDEQKKKLLIPGVKGEKIGALGLTEPVAGSDLAHIRTVAKREGDHYVLNGSKTFITNGCRADFVLVLCKTSPEAGYKGFSTLIVEKGMPGFIQGKPLEKLGWQAGDTAELTFENVAVPVANRLGEEGSGFYNAMANLEWERLIMALGTVCSAQLAFDKTKIYVLQREAFGRPIGKFQVNRHKMVDMAMEIEAARQLNYHALRKLMNAEPCAIEVSMAKVFASRMGEFVATTCLQLHGGYGYMREYEIERFFRDVRINAIGGGTSEVLKEIVGRLMGI